MKLKRIAGLALAALTIAAPAAQAQIKLEKPKVAFIFLGTATDGGWSQSQNAARLALAKAEHEKVPYVENVPEQTNKVEQAVDLFINHGANVIIAGSYGYSDAMLAEAKAHPQVAFVNMAGISSAPNLESPYPKTYQGWYLAGMSAGYATKSKQLGMMLGFPIPDVLWDINAFALGAQAVNPGTIVHVAFVNSWSDPVKEAQISAAMIQQGADVIATDMDSPAALVVAEKAGKYSIGYQVDMAKSAPNGILTSVVFHWEKELVPAVAAMKAGTWKSGGTPLYGIDTGVVDITKLQHIPADDIAKIEAVRQKMIAGTFSPWTGPITDQSGKVEVAAGQEPSVDDLWNMNYLVSNVKGSMK
ncbi:MAG TPA: BMP family ABC transporter substrate-binding protein [Acidocella sp.]|nr:BMP family ABC transporter substrate-binding protein [Acidocella sp.]